MIAGRARGVPISLVLRFSRRGRLRKRLLAIFCALALAAILVNLNFVMHWDVKQTRTYIIDCFKQIKGEVVSPNPASGVLASVQEPSLDLIGHDLGLFRCHYIFICQTIDGTFG